MSEVITSATNPLVKQLRALDQRKTRDETGRFLLEGERAISEALAAGWNAELLVSAAAPGQRPALLSSARQVRQLAVSPALMSRITGKDNPMQLLAVLQQRWGELPDLADGLWVVCEEIRDPGNLGTILRSASAAGARGVLLLGACCDPYSPEAVRASVGTFARLTLVRAGVDDFLTWRTAYRGQVVATSLTAAQDYRQNDYSLPLLLLLGTEQSGLSGALLASASRQVRIPMASGVESLNLAAATVLMLYEIQRSRL